MLEPIFTPQELADILAYNHPKYVWAAVSEVYDLALIALVLAVLVRPLYRWSERAAARFEPLRRWPVLGALSKIMDRAWRGPGWGTAVLFATATYGLMVLAYLPAGVYFDLHEWRFGLSTYTVGGLVWDEVKGVGVTGLLKILLVFGLYGLARRSRRWWVVLGAVCSALLLVSAVIDPYRARLYFEQEPLAGGALRQDIDGLMRKAGIEYSDILVEKTSRATRKVQAYFAGQGPTRTIVFNDMLLKEFDRGEVLAAVAHEAGHVGERKWPNRIAAALALFALLALFEWMFRISARRRWWGASERADVRTLPLVTFSVYLLISLGAPVSAYFSRERERAADRYAMALTQDPAAFRRMLVKATRINKMDPDPPRWVVLRGSGHPPMSERIRAADDWQKNGAPASGSL
jgi:STE24 endopeptidase